MSSDGHGWRSAGEINSQTTNRSRDRDRTGDIQIGRKSLGNAGAAILGIGVMASVFHYGEARDPLQVIDGIDGQAMR